MNIIIILLLFNFTQNNTVHTYKCHIIQYGLFFSVACLTTEGDLIALLGKMVTGIKLLGAHALKRCKKVNE